jgi:hypothetical protein
VSTPKATRPTGWLAALVMSVIASGVALWLQDVMRDTWQVRTLPERVEEWLLLFVPLDLFERGLQQLGADAKVVALFGTMVGMAGLLIALGVLALRAAWTSWWLLGLGAAMWLMAMAIVMPITGAGFFATGLLIAPALVNAAYLIVFLGYACVLIGGRLLSHLGLEERPTMLAERRALLAGVVATVLAGGIARLVGSQGGLVASSLPLAAAPTPEPALTPTPAADAATGTAAQPTPTPPIAAATDRKSTRLNSSHW